MIIVKNVMAVFMVIIMLMSSPCQPKTIHFVIALFI